MAGAAARILFAVEPPPTVCERAEAPSISRLGLEQLAAANSAWRAGTIAQRLPVSLRIVSRLRSRLAPPDGAVVSATLGAVPFRLFDGAWTREKREILRAQALAALEIAIPGAGAHVLAAEVIVPPDIEEAIGATDGDLAGGEMAADQLPGPWPEHPFPRCPLKGLYLAGSWLAMAGTCAAGAAVARTVAADLASGKLQMTAIIIGGGVNGLVAAAYLARAGRKVLLLEAKDTLGGACATAPFATGLEGPALAQALIALDPRVVSELKLARRGLKFAVRDMPTVALRADGKHLVIGRDVRATARGIAAHSRADAEAWPRFRRELFDLARKMRPFWWDEPRHGWKLQPEIAVLRRQGIAAWLDCRFECEELKAVLAADASGVSPLVPGSPLILLWRAAQEMCGLQGAAAIPLGGPGALVEALTSAAKIAGVEIRTGARGDRHRRDRWRSDGRHV